MLMPACAASAAFVPSRPAPVGTKRPALVLKAPSVRVSHGAAYSWVRRAPGSGQIEAIGITFSESMLSHLPTPKEIKSEMPMEGWVLAVPKAIKGMPYDHIEIDWNPLGHPPAGIYDKPHFDFHFYTIPPKLQDSITVTGNGLKRCMKKPPARFVPPGYILPPGTAFPNMGVHWVNPATAPEVRGGTFMSTLIFGSYDGRMAFWEPMVTLKYLLSKQNHTQKLAEAKSFAQSGYYPTSYSVSYDAKAHSYTVALEGLEYHRASK